MRVAYILQDKRAAVAWNRLGRNALLVGAWEGEPSAAHDPESMQSDVSPYDACGDYLQLRNGLPSGPPGAHPRVGNRHPDARGPPSASGHFL